MTHLIGRIKEPVSALTHFIALIAFIPPAVLLILKGVYNSSPVQVAAFAIFGASLILLYSASTIYHTLNITEKVNLVLRRIDHMMIYVLIAGTYTPVCLIALNGFWGVMLLSIVWSMAVIGIVTKIYFINIPRKFTSIIYLIMGWSVIIAFVPLVQTLGIAELALLSGGGLFYTIGAVIYALKRPKLNFKLFGFHEIFHIFVMLGSLCHILLMFFLT